MTILKEHETHKAIIECITVNAFYCDGLTAQIKEIYNTMQIDKWEMDDFIDAVQFGAFNKAVTHFTTKKTPGIGYRIKVEKNEHKVLDE